MFHAVSEEDEFHRGVRMAYECDRTSFDNSDGFEEDDDLCDASSSDQDASSSNHWRGWKTECAGPSSSRSWRDGGLLGSSSVSSSGVSTERDTRKIRHSENSTTHQVLPLVEIAAKEVACHIPFEVVEHFNQPVPVEVQLRIAFWSFPTSEEDIRLYSCLANSNDSEFTKGEDLWKQGCVKNLLQIGFHLSATVVQNPLSNSLKGSYNVAVTFDRRRVTSCNCNCQNSPSWCAHIVAVCLFRIYQPDQVCLRAPVSESLSRLGRDDLQKFAQYLINELPQQILPTAQKLLDDLLSKQNTYINTTSGAPDPTAGASIDEKTSWWLDESQLRDNLGKILRKHSQIQPMVVGDAMCLQTPISPVASEWANWLRPLRAREPEGVWNLLAIVRELFKRGDCNAVPLLKILTVEILAYQSIILWWFQTKVSHQTGSSGHGKINSSQSNALATQHGCSSICDEIVSLWRLASLNPSFSSAERDGFYQLLKDWHVNTLERVWKSKANNSSTTNSNNNNNKKTDFEIFAGFKPAMEACLLDWDDYLVPRGSGLTRSWLTPCSQTHTRKDQAKIFASGGSESDQNRSNLDKSASPGVRRTGRSLDMNQFFEKTSPSSNPEEAVPSLSPSTSKSSPQNISSEDSVIKPSSEELKGREMSCDIESVNNETNQPDVNGRPIDSYRSSFSSEGFCETSETDYNNESDEELPVGQRRQRAKRAQGTESSQEIAEKKDSNKKSVQMDNLCNGNNSQSSSKNSCPLTDALSSLQAQNRVEDRLIEKEEKEVKSEAKQAEENPELTADDSIRLDDTVESNSPSSNSTPESSSQNARNFSHPKKCHSAEPIATCSSSHRKNVQRVCGVNLGDEQIKVIIKAISDPNEVLLARTEALHAHGLTKEACTLAVELAHNLLNHPPNLQIDLPNPPLRLKRARRVNPVCHQISLFVSSILAKATFLCQVLSEVEEYHALAFKVGLFGLELARPPASTKSLEVKLFHQESEIAALLKKIPIGDEEMKILRERANMLREGNHMRGESILPIALANFIFDALVYSSPLTQGLGSRSGSSIAPQPCIIRGRRESTDEKLAFEASIAALGMKANVCEADHPLLCEGTRKQRGEFIIELLIHYRDDNEALDKIMEKVCDKDLGLNHKEPKPALAPATPDLAATNTVATEQKPVEIPKSTNDSDVKLPTDVKNLPEEPCSSNASEAYSVSEEKADESSANKNLTVDKQRMSDGEGSEGAASPSWGENYKAWEARFRCTNFKTNKKHTVGMASIDSSAPETTSSDNSPTVVRRTVWMRPGSDSGSSGESSDSFASSSSGDKGVKNNLPCSTLNPPPGSNVSTPGSSTQHAKNGPLPVNKDINQKVANCANRMNTCSLNERPHSSSKLNFVLGSNSHHASEGCQLSCCDPLPLFANQQRFNLTNNNILSMKPISNRHKNKKLYPSIPNQPSEASSCFMHELAKTLLDKAGGSSHSAVLFTQQPPNQNHEGPHRNLHMCALKIAFYALGLNNFVTQNWLSRTYSQNVAWIANQAVEIGAQAINFLIGKWEGYFTPTEASNLADRAFLHSSNDPVTKKAASRLALSCLPHAQALTLQEIQRAIALCKEHSSEMLEEACLAVEQVAKAGGELNPEVLFHVARKWYDLYETSLRGRNDSSTRDHRNRLPFVQASIGEFQVPSSSSSSPILHNSYFNHHHHHNPPNGHDLSNVRGSHNSNIATAVELNMRNNGHHHPPNNPGGSVLSFAQSSLQVIQAMPNYPMSPHPNQFIGIFTGLPAYHPTPFPFIPPFLAPGPEAASTYQYPTYMTGPPPQMSNNAASNLPMAVPTPSLPPYRNQIPPSLLTGPALMPNMMMAQSPQRFSLIPGANPGPLVFPIVQAQPNSHLVTQPPALCLSNKTQSQPHQQHNQKQLDYLYSAYRVAVLAMEALRRKNHDEGPKNKFARNPPYEEDIKWMVALTKELGSPYFQYFCKCCELSITSPFVLLYIVKEASSYYSHSHNSQSHQIRSSILSSLVSKCQHMFTAAIVSKVNNGPSPKNEAEISQEIHFLIQGARQVMDHQHLNEMVTKLRSLRNAKKDILAHIDNCLQQSANAV